MADLIINKGLIDSQGKIVNGNYISDFAPTKITYTGDVESEINLIKKWANKRGVIFEHKVSKKAESKVNKPDKSEPRVEELFPEEPVSKNELVSKIVNAETEKLMRLY